MENDIVYIYALKEIGKPFKEIRWIGQTNNLKRRFSYHKGCYVNELNRHKVNWVMSIDKNIEYIILEITNNKQADNREQYWIEKFNKDGYKLLNIKPGGNSTRGWSHKPESIKKMSLNRKGIPSKLKGIKRSQEFCNSISKAKMGKSNGRIGFVVSQKTKDKTSKTLMGHSVSKKVLKQLKLNGIIAGKVKRKKAMEIYYKNPSICLFCGNIIKVYNNQSPYHVKIKKFCNKKHNNLYQRRK